jgi:hypothetical protein
MNKYVKLVEQCLTEMPLAMNIEDRPLVKDWEPTRWPVQWQEEGIDDGDHLLLVGKGRFNTTIIGMFDISDPAQPKLVVGAMGGFRQLKEEGQPFAKAFQMTEVAAAKDVRGKGLGTKFHEMLIRQYSAIASDNALFSKKKGSIDGIVGIWLKELAKKYTVRIYSEEKDDFVGPVGKKLDNDEDTFLVATRY